MQRSGSPEGRPVALPPGGVPAELDEFLRLDGSHSLLVRGPPGSGKTSLAVALTERFYGRRLFVTSRVDPLQLRHQFPWLAGRPQDPGTALTILDSFGTEGSVANSARVVARAQEVLTEPGLAAGDPATEFLWLPAAVQEALGQVEEEHPTLLVFDSWDALIEQFLSVPTPPQAAVPDRAAVERFLLRRVHASGAHLVLVVERDGGSQLDYLVDGVVTTGSQFVEERLERWLTLQKLRRVRIEEALHPFTLEGGRFACVEPLPDRWPTDPGPLSPDPSPAPGSIWPGNGSFASEFGRLPVGLLTVLEVDPRLPQHCERRLVVPMMLHVLATGGRVLFTPPSTFRAEEIYDLASSMLSPRVLRERLRIFCAEARSIRRPEVARVLIARDEEPIDLEGELPIDRRAERFLSVAGRDGAPNLFIDSLSNLRAFARARGADLSPVTLPATMQHFLSVAPCAGVVLGGPNDAALDGLLGLAALHIRVRERHGRAVVYGVRPRTGAFVLAQPTPVVPGSPSYEFRRIV